MKFISLLFFIVKDAAIGVPILSKGNIYARDYKVYPSEVSTCFTVFNFLSLHYLTIQILVRLQT